MANPLEGWGTLLSEAWTSWAVLPFVAGSLATARYAAGLARDGRDWRAFQAALAGTYLTFWVSALLLPLPEAEFVSFTAVQTLGLVLWVGWPGLALGAVAPVLWARWEARQAEDAPEAGAG